MNQSESTRRGDDERAAQLALDELGRARAGNGPMASAHEAYAVILEELDEFKAEVFKKSSQRSRLRMRSELVQVAAMALRALVDLSVLEVVAVEQMHAPGTPEQYHPYVSTPGTSRELSAAQFGERLASALADGTAFLSDEEEL